MIKQLVMSTLLAGAIGLTANQAMAADEPVYGHQLMTQQERMDYREKMRSMKTEEERAAFRMEHHKQMQERAKEQGVTLPDEPMPRGKGMGPKDGTGPAGGGMGPGNGMGSGGGMGKKP
jgi:hypothetical protein